LSRRIPRHELLTAVVILGRGCRSITTVSVGDPKETRTRHEQRRT
jgi:hypothetical protein